MVVRVCARCNSSHLLRGLHLQFRGWSSAVTDELAEAVSRLREQGLRPSHELLRAHGVSEQALERTCVAEFHSESVAVEAIEPRTVILGGAAYDALRHLPPELH